MTRVASNQTPIVGNYKARKFKCKVSSRPRNLLSSARKIFPSRPLHSWNRCSSIWVTQIHLPLRLLFLSIVLHLTYVAFHYTFLNYRSWRLTSSRASCQINTQQTLSNGPLQYASTCELSPSKQRRLAQPSGRWLLFVTGSTYKSSKQSTAASQSGLHSYRRRTCIGLVSDLPRPEPLASQHQSSFHGIVPGNVEYLQRIQQCAHLLQNGRWTIRSAQNRQTAGRLQVPPRHRL